MDAATRDRVRQRAGRRCEYCGLHEDQSPLAALHIEHVLPRKHGGTDDLDNLALACIDCNLHKGSNVAGYDPESDLLADVMAVGHSMWLLAQGAPIGIDLIGKGYIGFLPQEDVPEILANVTEKDRLNWNCPIRVADVVENPQTGTTTIYLESV